MARRLQKMAAVLGISPWHIGSDAGWLPGQRPACIKELLDIVRRAEVAKEPMLEGLIYDTRLIAEGVAQKLLPKTVTKRMVEALQNNLSMAKREIEGRRSENQERERGRLHPGVVVREVNDLLSVPPPPDIPAVVTRSGEIVVRTPEGQRRAYVDAEGQLIIGELVEPKAPEPAKEDLDPKSTVIPGRPLRRIDA